MADLLFLFADLWMIFAGFFYGWRFIKRHDNYLLGLEWMAVATSGTNFLVWSALGGDEGSPLYDVAYFFDAISRSIGITLILILGLMAVTHGYKPSPMVDIGAFGLAIVAGLYLQQFRGHELHLGPAAFYMVVNVLTALFVAYFVSLLWRAGATGQAMATAVVTAAATSIALMYDFLPFPDDDLRTRFYILALTTWGFQMFVYYRAYGALREHNEQSIPAGPRARKDTRARASQAI